MELVTLMMLKTVVYSTFCHMDFKRKSFLNVLYLMQTTRYVFILIYIIKYNKLFLNNWELNAIFLELVTSND